MAFIYFDDDMPNHPKIVALSDAAFRLWVASVGHCAKYLTDGVLSPEIVHELAPRARSSRARDKVAAELVESGRWEVVTAPGDPTVVAYIVHDYLDHNPSREVVLARKAKAAEKQRKWRQATRAEETHD